MTDKLTLRIATEGDATEILKIYAPYVKDTAISFEYDVPTLDEIKDRINKILKKYPYIVAVLNNKIVGYAYASAFKERAAYDRSVETTVYIDMNYRCIGIGKKLYQALEEMLKKQNILNLNACIAYSNVEDEKLSNNSTYFHEKLGYKKVAHFTKCGYKFGRWYDVIWMEKIIGEHLEPAKPVIIYIKQHSN